MGAAVASRDPLHGEGGRCTETGTGKGIVLPNTTVEAEATAAAAATGGADTGKRAEK